jgi:flagellar basal-body rod protein FlgB
MFLTDIVNRGTLPALEKLSAFTEHRQRVLADNIANIDTPNYKVKHLDPKAFQAALGEALDRRKEDMAQPFTMDTHEQFRTNPHGHLVVTPTVQPENILFHDGTNASIEKQMSALAENAMTHELSNELLRGKFTGLLTAIRGRLS